MYGCQTCFKLLALTERKVKPPNSNRVISHILFLKVDPYPFSNPVTLRLTLVTALTVDINRLTNVVIVQSRNIATGLFRLIAVDNIQLLSFDEVNVWIY